MKCTLHVVALGALFAAAPFCLAAGNPPAAPAKQPDPAAWVAQLAPDPLAAALVLKTLPGGLTSEERVLAALQRLFDLRTPAPPPVTPGPPQTTCEGDPSDPVPWPRNGC